MLKESLPKSLGDTTVDLPVDDGRIDDTSDVIDSCVTDNGEYTGFRILFDFTCSYAVGMCGQAGG